jgi:hypothetical protein
MVDAIRSSSSFSRARIRGVEIVRPQERWLNQVRCQNSIHKLIRGADLLVRLKRLEIGGRRPAAYHAIGFV